MSSRPPAVSVVMAVWNAEGYLPAAIEQLQAQTMGDFEVVVVDDASQDDTPVVLKDWAERDTRVRVLRHDERAGVARARNLAVSHASGTYVWFTDVDDRWSPQILQRLTERAEATQADVVVCGAVGVVDGTDGPGDVIPGAYGEPVAGGLEAVRRLLLGEIQGHLWNKLFRRCLFDDVRFPATRAFSDLGAMGWLLGRAGTVSLLPENLYTYLIRQGSILNSREVRAEDLLDCRESVRGAVAAAGGFPALAREFRRFEYAMVFIPTLNDQIRRGLDDERARRVRRRVRSEIRLADVVRLAAAKQWRLAAAAAAMKTAYPAYAGAYRTFRRLKWGSVGFGAG